jgi:hypothetical protein
VTSEDRVRRLEEQSRRLLHDHSHRSASTHTCQNNGSCPPTADTGERVYQHRIASGAFSAAPIASDGGSFHERGRRCVRRRGRRLFELLSTNPMGEVLIHSRSAPERLFIRGRIICSRFEERSPLTFARIVFRLTGVMVLVLPNTS